jgi:hypothetical protein
MDLCNAIISNSQRFHKDWMMTAAAPTELEKLDNSFLKSVIARSLLTVAVAMPLMTAANAVVDHLKTEQAQTYTVQNWQHLSDNSMFDIVRLSENAPADLAVLKDTIQQKRELMDKAVTEIGMAGRMVGFAKGPEARAEAFSAMVDKVQTKIDELETTGWKPDPALANRTADERQLDDWFLQNAKIAHQNTMRVDGPAIRSR